jgi:undecaprenyl-diphosphatase
MDEQVLLLINQGFTHPLLDQLFWLVSQRTWFAAPLSVILLCYSIFRCRGYGMLFFFLLVVTVAISNSLGDVLKSMFSEPRPCQIIFEQLRDLNDAIPSPCGSSMHGMPSNHAINFCAATTFIAFTTSWRVWKVCLSFITVLVCLSRIYLGKHYPSQVLVGSVIGGAVGWLCVVIFHNIFPNQDSN